MAAAFRRSAREEKQALGSCMAPKNGKHRPLIVRRQVKETVPGDDARRTAG